MSEEKPDLLSLEYYTGATLEGLATASHEKRIPLIEGLIYEKSATMFYADDGVGKSLLVLQIVCEASQGMPVFGLLNCSKPLKTIWIQAERHPLEVGERISHFKNNFTPNFNNIVVTPSWQGYDLERDEFRHLAFKHLDKIVSEWNYPDLIVVDPIYSVLTGDISTPKTANTVTRLSTALQRRYRCCTIFIHHSNRGARDKETGKRIEGDFYGNRFLSAHFSGIFHIRRRQSETGAEFVNKKDSFSCLMRGFRLDYDTESHLSTIDSNSFNSKDKVVQTLRQYRTQSKLFTINQLIEDSSCSPNIVYALKKGDMKDYIIDTGKLYGRAKLYKSEVI